MPKFYIFFEAQILLCKKNSEKVNFLKKRLFFYTIFFLINVTQ